MKRPHPTAVAVADVFLIVLLFASAGLAAVLPSLVVAIGIPTIAAHRIVTVRWSPSRHQPVL